MKASITYSLHLGILACIAFTSSALAVVSMDYVAVGNAGNSADTRLMNDGTTGYGRVDYAYWIGKYEVTNAQYCEFLNAKGASNGFGIYHDAMASYGISQSGNSGSFTYNITGGLANRPVVFVSWFDAARFTNWLHNGQGSGDTETGAYTLEGATSGIVVKNVGATVWIPSEDEWYKAAFFNGATEAYALGFTSGNYGNTLNHSTDVGGFSSGAYYGTFDQGGNVWEWNDADIRGFRGARGGSWYQSGATIGYDGAGMSSSGRYSVASGAETFNIGFRVASIIPEPTSSLLAMLTGVLMIVIRKR